MLDMVLSGAALPDRMPEATAAQPCLQACLDLGPAIIYNVPARTAQDIPNDVIADMAGHANFLGVKECTGNQRIQVPIPVQ
jgi:Dihydrodipicolinate synthetase family